MESVRWDSLTTNLMDYCLNLWGEAIEYHTVSGEIYSLSGIVDLNALMVDPETHVTVQSTQPQVRLCSANLPHAPNPGDSIIIRDQHYQIIESQADGQGTTLCLLHHDSHITS